jgi:hypothetical protein
MLVLSGCWGHRYIITKHYMTKLNVKGNGGFCISLSCNQGCVLGKGTADSPALLSVQAARQKRRDAAQFPFLWTIGLPLSERRMEVHGQINVTLPTAASACRPARLSGESERVAVFSFPVFNGSTAHSLIPSQLHREGRKVNETL